MSPPRAQIKPNPDGSVTVEYVPTASGPHDINFNFQDKPAVGTPLRVNVDASNGRYVSAFGPGLIQGGSGEQLDFYVTGSSKDLDLKIDGAGHAEVTKKDEQGGKVHYQYTPMSPGEYSIHIHHKGKPIHGSPFQAKVSGEGRKRSQVSAHASSEYKLGDSKVDFSHLVALLKSPGGSTEPCLLKKTSDGSLGIASFQPRQKGTYEVIVTQDGKAVTGSPFKIDISDAQVSSAHKVKVSGATKTAVANQWNEIKINIQEAGYGSLGISVEGGHRSDLELKAQNATEYLFRYKPHEPGVYLVNVKFGDDHITGSPLLVSVGGEPSGRERVTVDLELTKIDPAQQGQPCHLELKIPGTDPLEMDATLTSPSGKTVSCMIQGLPDDLCSIKFTPEEEGVHTIGLKYKGVHFAGSPFQYTVGKFTSGGTHKVAIGGPGVEQGEVGAKNEFNIYYREAGAGTLSISVEGPSKAVLEVVDRKNGYVTVAYTVSAEGDYGIHVKLNEEHVPESPVTLRVLPESRDAKKVVVIGLRGRGHEVGKPVTFTVHLSGAVGQLNAELKTPSGSEDDVSVTDLDDEEKALRFVPKENGIYYVGVRLNEAHIPGSPIPILIGKHGADPALVFAKGPGLENGQVGKPSTFEVVTLNAGAGTLAVHVEGPAKVAVVCKEGPDGYEFSYTPPSPGVYMVNVKYSNITIAGAPFRSVVAGEGKKSDIRETSELFVETVEKKPGVSNVKRFHGDASRVLAHGNGLQKAFSGRPATFVVDYKDAGQALLTLGILSPSGNPVKEISVKKAKTANFNVSYTTVEKGAHTLVIRWGAEEIPGSPFSIQV